MYSRGFRFANEGLWVKMPSTGSPLALMQSSRHSHALPPRPGMTMPLPGGGGARRREQVYTNWHGLERAPRNLSALGRLPGEVQAEDAAGASTDADEAALLEGEAALHLRSH